MGNHVVIALFRHGLTVENERKAYLGWTDSPLLDEERLSKQPDYDLYISSDLKRCLRTLEIMWPGVVPLTLSEFREMNFGDLEGKTYEDLKDEQSYIDWLADPFGIAPPNGESFDRFGERVQRGWTKVVDAIEENQLNRVAIVTHGGVIRYLLTKYSPERRDFWDWKVSHGEGYELVFDLDQLRRDEPCTLLREVPLTENGHG